MINLNYTAPIIPNKWKFSFDEDIGKLLVYTGDKSVKTIPVDAEVSVDLNRKGEIVAIEVVLSKEEQPSENNGNV